MWNEIVAWQETLTYRPDLSAKTIALYTQDVRRFATWLQSEHPGLGATQVTSIDAKMYRDHQSGAHQPDVIFRYGGGHQPIPPPDDDRGR